MNLVSPCKALCKLTDDDICAGCNRTIEEITNWRTYTAQTGGHTLKIKSRLYSFG